MPITFIELFKNIKIYEKNCYLAAIYPAIIYFLETIYKESKDTYIGFLSRDAYFLYLLYKQIANDSIENKDYSYIFSSRKCFTNKYNSVYKDYILSLLTIKKKLLLIDVYGSGETYTQFIEKYKLKNENIRLLFFSGKKDNLADVFYTGDIGFKLKRGYNHFFLECLFRGPNTSITHLTKDGINFIANHIEEKKMNEIDRINDLEKKYLINLYNKILENMPYNKNIRYFTLVSLNYKHNNNIIPINIEKINYSGLLVLDIDNVITNVKNYKYINKIVNSAADNKIKIILVTARQWPFSYGKRSIIQKISSIESILYNIKFNYDENIIDIWYNPFTFINKIKSTEYVNNKSVRQIKCETIKTIMNNYDIKCDSVIYFDDTKENIDECKKLNINCYIVERGEGINENNEKQFENFLNKNKSII